MHFPGLIGNERAVSDSSTGDGKTHVGSALLSFCVSILKQTCFLHRCVTANFEQLPAVPLDMTHKNLCQLHRGILRA